MTTFLLVRHGHAAYDLAEERRLVGGARDWVPLSELGCRQIAALCEQLRPLNAQLILASPMTRALQSAAILGRALDLPLEVAFDLHEWLPDLTMTYDRSATAQATYEEMTRFGGEWPEGETRSWEPLSSVRRRVRSVLDAYNRFARVVVVCHGVVIFSLTGQHIGNAGFCTYEVTPG